MKDEYNYLTAGYDAFLNRGIVPSDEMLEDDVRINISQISGSSLVAGQTISSDGKLKIDWEKSMLVASDGARNRVEIGKIEGTENYGIRIFDAFGNLILSATGQLQTEGVADVAITSAKIESLTADKITTGTLSASTEINVGANNIKIDGVNKRITINDGTYDRVIIGWQENGF